MTGCLHSNYFYSHTCFIVFSESSNTAPLTCKRSKHSTHNLVKNVSVIKLNILRFFFPRSRRSVFPRSTWRNLSLFFFFYCSEIRWVETEPTRRTPGTAAPTFPTSSKLNSWQTLCMSDGEECVLLILLHSLLLLLFFLLLLFSINIRKPEGKRNVTNRCSRFLHATNLWKNKKICGRKTFLCVANTMSEGFILLFMFRRVLRSKILSSSNIYEHNVMIVLKADKRHWLMKNSRFKCALHR